jgi:uncharacterized membrane protein (DUF2068 family)
MACGVSNVVTVRRQHDPGFLLIAVWKLFRGVLLLVIGLWALASWHGYCPPGEHSVAVRWCINILRDAGSHRFIHRFLANHGVMRERNLELICIVASLYSLKLFIEGFGLWFEKIWAQYLTVTLTSLFIPVAVYELTTHLDLARLAALIANILIVGYLVMRLRQRKKTARAAG